MHPRLQTAHTSRFLSNYCSDEHVAAHHSHFLCKYEPICCQTLTSTTISTDATTTTTTIMPIPTTAIASRDMIAGTHIRRSSDAHPTPIRRLYFTRFR